MDSIIVIRQVCRYSLWLRYTYFYYTCYTFKHSKQRSVALKMLGAYSTNVKTYFLLVSWQQRRESHDIWHRAFEFYQNRFYSI